MLLLLLLLRKVSNTCKFLLFEISGVDPSLELCVSDGRRKKRFSLLRHADVTGMVRSNTVKFLKFEGNNFYLPFNQQTDHVRNRVADSAASQTGAGSSKGDQKVQSKFKYE